MKRGLLFFGILVSAILMQACAIAPGMTMTEPAELDDENTIRVQPITLDLLKQLDAARENDVQALADKLSSEPEAYIIGIGDDRNIVIN